MRNAKMKQTVFIVDDEFQMRTLISDYLKTQGYEVQCFASAPDFIKSLLISNHSYSKINKIAVVSDIHMNPMNGIELLKSVKKSRPEIPVVLMTAETNRDQESAARREGAFEYLSKPFPLSVLGKALQLALKNK